MTSPTLGTPCAPWPLDTSCLPADWVEPYTADQLAAMNVATEILWRLTAGQFGTCSITLRPCSQKCTDFPSGLFGPYNGLPVPFVNGGEWFNMGCLCRSKCGCGPICEIKLPGPVNSITEIRIDGLVVNPSTYWVHNARRLVRKQPDCWPECQHMDRPITDEGTFSITYVRGEPVPPGGRRAVSYYAVELWKACGNAKGCRLPQRVREITREGISMTLLDPMEFLDEGLVGLPEVDTWLRSVNPTGRRSQSRVYSPDSARYRRQTSP